MNVAIEHRLVMHVETLTYMLHQLPLASKMRDRAAEPALSGPPRKPGMIEVPAGEIKLGLSRDAGQFGWDNEFDALTRSRCRASPLTATK